MALSSLRRSSSGRAARPARRAGRVRCGSQFSPRALAESCRGRLIARAGEHFHDLHQSQKIRVVLVALGTAAIAIARGIALTASDAWPESASAASPWLAGLPWPTRSRYPARAGEPGNGPPAGRSSLVRIRLMISMARPSPRVRRLEGSVGGSPQFPGAVDSAPARSLPGRAVCRRPDRFDDCPQLLVGQFLAGVRPLIPLASLRMATSATVGSRPLPQRGQGSAIGCEVGRIGGAGVELVARRGEPLPGRSRGPHPATSVRRRERWRLRPQAELLKQRRIRHQLAHQLDPDLLVCGVRSRSAVIVSGLDRIAEYLEPVPERGGRGFDRRLVGACRLGKRLLRGVVGRAPLAPPAPPPRARSASTYQ